MAAEKLHRKNGERGKSWTYQERIRVLTELFDLAQRDTTIFTIIQLCSSYGITTPVYYKYIARAFDKDEAVMCYVDGIKELLESRLISIGLTQETIRLNCIKSMFILKTSYNYRDNSVITDDDNEYIQTHVIPQVIIKDEVQETITTPEKKTKPNTSKQNTLVDSTGIYNIKQ